MKKPYINAKHSLQIKPTCAPVTQNIHENIHEKIKNTFLYCLLSTENYELTNKQLSLFFTLVM